MPAWAYVMATAIPALATVVIALINRQKIGAVQTSVDGQQDELVQQLAAVRAELTEVLERELHDLRDAAGRPSAPAAPQRRRKQRPRP